MNRAPGMFKKPTKPGLMQYDRMISAPDCRVVYTGYAVGTKWMQGDTARIFLKQRFKVLGFLTRPSDHFERTKDGAYAVMIDDTVAE